MASGTSYDVTVVGGGTAGCIAALAAARRGVKTLLIEQCGHLGGLAAIGMTWGGFFDADHNQVVKGIPDELIGKAKSMGGGLGYVHFETKENVMSVMVSVEPERYRFLLQEELQKSGCDVLLFSTVTHVETKDGKIAWIQVVNKAGITRYKSNVFIDASGDADLATLGRVPWESERGARRQCQTSIFKMSNVDADRLENYMERKINVKGLAPWKLRYGSMRRDFEYWCPWKNDDTCGTMPRLFGVYWHGIPGDIHVNCTSVDIDPLDPLVTGEADYSLRKEVYKVVDYLKSKVDGFQESYLSHIYDIGVREGRRIKGRYTVTVEDIVQSRTHDDVIGYGAYPLDVHDSTGRVDIVTQHELKMKSKSTNAYQIPYTALLPREIDNLIVVGRCISSTYEAQSALRGIGPCMVEGEAAGVAASLAVSEGKDACDVSISKLQKELSRNDVYLGKGAEEG